MTYGDNVGEMRDAMATLLGWHRIQQRLGGGGSVFVPVTTSPGERQRMGQIIQRYRLAALTWCLEAVTATTPKTDPAPAARTPAENLRHQLQTAVEAAGRGERLLPLLAERHDKPLLDVWQALARAATLGEHDFGAGVNRGGLTAEQANTVLKDAADVARGLVLLDRRYDNVPGWVLLKQAVRLDRAAEATAMAATRVGMDPSVVDRGWRPPAGRIEGPALPGVAGAAQAQHNLLVELGRLPNALNLRRVLVSQAQVSHEAARHAAAVAPDLVERFTERATLYRELVRASRDIGGLVGGGGQAVVESQNAAARLHRAEARPSEVDALRKVARLMTGTDARIGVTIEHGFAEQLYFVSVRFPRLADQQVGGVFPVRERWMPVTSDLQTDLLPLARSRLGPAPYRSTMPTGRPLADNSRPIQLPARSLPRGR